MFINERFEKIQNYLDEIGEYPQNILYVRYFNMNMGNLEGHGYRKFRSGNWLPLFIKNYLEKKT